MEARSKKHRLVPAMFSKTEGIIPARPSSLNLESISDWSIFYSLSEEATSDLVPVALCNNVRFEHGITRIGSNGDHSKVSSFKNDAPEFENIEF